MVFKFVMQPCLCYAHYINMVIEFVKIVLEGTGVEHGNTELSFYTLAMGFGGWDLDNERVAPQVGALNLDHHETWDGQSSLPFFSASLELLTSLCQFLPFFFLFFLFFLRSMGR